MPNYPSGPPTHKGQTVSQSEGTYLEPTQDAGRDFFMRGIEGEVVMLNLLRFRDAAEYSANPDLEPNEPISRLLPLIARR